MIACPLRNRPATLKLTHRIGHATLVGQGAGSHEASLGHKRRTGRCIAKFGPEHLDIGPPALGPVAVGKHRVLLGSAGQVAEHLEPLRCGLPVSDPVVGEAQELDHLDHLGGTLDQRVQDASGVIEAFVVEGPCGLAQLGRRTGTGSIAQCPAEGDIGIGQAPRCVRKRLPLESPVDPTRAGRAYTTGHSVSSLAAQTV